MARKHGDQATVRFETVAKTLLAFAHQSAEARCKAQLEDWSYNSARLELADKRIKLNFVYRPMPKAHSGPLVISQSGGYATGAKLSLPARPPVKTMEVIVDDSEVFGIALDDNETPPTKDDRLAADNDNIGEDAIPEDDDVEPTDELKPVKPKAVKTKKPAVKLDWVPAPRINKINKSS